MTEVRGHKRVTEGMLRQPFYYSKWFYCTNRQCKTTLIMPPECRVFREDGKVIEGMPEWKGDVVMETLDGMRTFGGFMKAFKRGDFRDE